MSGVVLRCPNCGTTRGTPGECEACHEAAVRYYCTNHTPGRWLDATACPQCGAVFGARAPSPAAAPSSRRPRTGPGAARPPTAAPAPRVTPAPSPRPTSIRPAPPASREREPDMVTDREPYEPASRIPRWQELLLAAARARTMRRDAVPDMGSGRPRRGLGGCLFRMVLIGVVVFIALSAAPMLLGGALLRMLGFY